MAAQRYAVNQYMIESLLAKVREGEIAIPEIQRPFVWDASQVRDLLDSLYKGYPVGYLIAWRNPDVKLKDGQVALGKMILIDGQQRVTALTAAVLDRFRDVQDRSRHPLRGADAAQGHRLLLPPCNGAGLPWSVEGG